MPILKPAEKSKSRTFSVRLPASLIDELEAVKSEAQAHGLVLDAAELIEKEIGAALRSARAELAKLAVVGGQGEGQ